MKTVVIQCSSQSVYTCTDSHNASRTQGRGRHLWQACRSDGERSAWLVAGIAQCQCHFLTWLRRVEVVLKTRITAVKRMKAVGTAQLSNASRIKEFTKLPVLLLLDTRFILMRCTVKTTVMVTSATMLPTR